MIFKKEWLSFLPSFLLFSLIIIYMLPSSQCLSIIYYDFECVFCGGTRSFKYFHQLKWITAVNLNPLVFSSLLFFWIVGFFALGSIYSNKIRQIYNWIFSFLNDKFFIFLGIFLIFYIIQTFIRMFLIK